MTIDQIITKIDYAIKNNIPYTGIEYKDQNVLLIPFFNLQNLKEQIKNNKIDLLKINNIHYGTDVNSIISQILIPIKIDYSSEVYPLKYDNMSSYDMSHFSITPENIKLTNDNKLYKIKELNNSIKDIKRHKENCTKKDKNDHTLSQEELDALLFDTTVPVNNHIQGNGFTMAYQYPSFSSSFESNNDTWTYVPDAKDKKYDYDYQFKKISFTQLKELLSSLSEDELAKLGYKVL